MKPLENGRQALHWMGIHFADDEPVSGQLKFARRSFAIAYAIIFIVISTLHVITFLQLRFISPEEFFFVLLQFVMTAHGTSAFITVYSCGAHIPIVFQNLTEIYEKCKSNESTLQK